MRERRASIAYRAAPYRPPYVLTDMPEDMPDAVKRMDAQHSFYTSMPPQDLVGMVYGHVRDAIPKITPHGAPTEAGAAAGAPDVAAPELCFVLGGLRSEGPVQDDGSSGAGWTFYFVDLAAKLGCVAMVTGKEIALQYGQVLDVDIPYGAYCTVVDNRAVNSRNAAAKPADAPPYTPPSEKSVPDISAAIAAVRNLVPEISDLALYVWFAAPDTVYVYLRDTIVIADVAIANDGTATVRNAEGFRNSVAEYLGRSSTSPRWSLDEVLAFYEGGPVDGALAEYFSVAKVREAALVFENDEMRGLGRGLIRYHGVGIIELLDKLVHAGDGETVVSEDEEDVASEMTLDPSLNAADDEETATLRRRGPTTGERRVAELAIRLLAYTPSGSAIARLHTLAETLISDELSALAADFFALRRRRVLGVRYDPIEVMDFRERSLKMGKGPVQVVPLVMNGYDIRNNLLEKLKDTGLTAHRVRAISGAGGVMTAVYLRPGLGDVEVLISIIPAPRQALVAYVAGSAAAAFAGRLAKHFGYSEDQIRADLEISPLWGELTQILGQPIAGHRDLLLRVNPRREVEVARTDTGRIRLDGDRITAEHPIVDIYTEDVLIQDLRILARPRVPALHRAAVYLACLGRADLVNPVSLLLRRLYDAMPGQVQLRSAIVEALEYASGDDVSAFLQRKLDDERARGERGDHSLIALLDDVIGNRAGNRHPIIQPSLTLPGVKERAPVDDEATSAAASDGAAKAPGETTV